MFLCFKLIIRNYHIQKQRKSTFKPKKILKPNIKIVLPLSSSSHQWYQLIKNDKALFVFSFIREMTHPLCTRLMPKNNHSHKHVHLNGEKSLVFSLLRSQSGCKESRFYGLPFGQVFDEQHWLRFFCNLNFPINFTCPLGK